MAKFEKGQSGNPKGRPKGVVDRRSRYLALIEQHMPDVVNQVVAAALGGDMTACRILIDKVLPRLRPVASAISLPQSGASTTSQSAAVVDAMLGGSLAPDQAAAAMSVIVDNARLREHVEFEARLEALEKGSSGVDRRDTANERMTGERHE
jgi:hypothetical protein